MTGQGKYKFFQYKTSGLDLSYDFYCFGIISMLRLHHAYTLLWLTLVNLGDSRILPRLPDEAHNVVVDLRNYLNKGLECTLEWKANAAPKQAGQRFPAFISIEEITRALNNTKYERHCDDPDDVDLCYIYHFPNAGASSVLPVVIKSYYEKINHGKSYSIDFSKLSAQNVRRLPS